MVTLRRIDSDLLRLFYLSFAESSVGHRMNAKSPDSPIAALRSGARTASENVK